MNREAWKREKETNRLSVYETTGMKALFWHCKFVCCYEAIDDFQQLHIQKRIHTDIAFDTFV